VEHAAGMERFLLAQNLAYLDTLLKIRSDSANIIRKNWNAFKFRKKIDNLVEIRRNNVKIVTKRIYPGYLKSTTASRHMRKKEQMLKEDLPNELRMEVIEEAEPITEQAQAEEDPADLLNLSCEDCASNSMS
jgi:hypothetical protein